MLSEPRCKISKLAGIKAKIGYKRRSGHYGGKPSLVVDNTLDRQFDVEEPDQFWVTDITYIKTLEGFAYLAVVIDLFSRRVIGWSLQSRPTTELVLQALLAAVWRQKPRHRVVIHSDQGSQFTAADFVGVLKHHEIRISMDGRGAWRDNVFVERLWRSVKYEEVYLHAYESVSAAKAGIAVPSASRIAMAPIPPRSIVRRVNNSV